MRVKTPNNSNIQAYLKPNTVYDVIKTNEHGCFEFDLISHGYSINGYSGFKGSSHLNGQDWIIVDNRKELRDFIKENKIKTTIVSKSLGKAESWLTTMSSEKEGKRRGDISDSTLASIMKMLHIDWSSDKPIAVHTKGFVPYTTKPCNYKTEQHKQRLQQAFWNGDFVK